MSDPTPTPIGKLKRSYLLHFIDASFGGQTPNWFLIGKHISDMSVELNPDTEVVKNIWDETVTNDNGYEPAISAETYYADTGDAIYEQIKDISMNRLTGDDCKTKVLEVVIDTDGTTHSAWQEDCIVKPQSYGGAQGGVNIPYNISFDGNRVQGTVTFTGSGSARVPSFSPTA